MRQLMAMSRILLLILFSTLVICSASYNKVGAVDRRGLQASPSPEPDSAEPMDEAVVDRGGELLVRRSVVPVHRRSERRGQRALRAGRVVVIAHPAPSRRRGGTGRDSGALDASARQWCPPPNTHTTGTASF